MRQRRARDVVRGQHVVSVEPTTTVREAARRMSDNDVGSVVVMAEGRLVGIFTERDVLSRVLAEGRDPDTTPVSSVVTASVSTVSGDTPILHVFHLMHEGGFRHVPVVDQGRTIGVVSLRDALGDEINRFHRELQRKQELSEIVA